MDSPRDTLASPIFEFESNNAFVSDPDKAKGLSRCQPTSAGIFFRDVESPTAEHGCRLTSALAASILGRTEEVIKTKAAQCLYCKIYLLTFLDSRNTLCAAYC